MIDKLRHVDARFGGRAVRFRLEGGAHWADLHAAHLGPLLALHQRILAGVWVREDLARVLSLACVGAPNRALAHAPDVVDVLEAEPAGNFAPLVARVLEAHLFGIPAPFAVWDERDPFAAPRQP